MNKKLLGSLLVTASILSGGVFPETAMAGFRHKRIFRSHNHKVFRSHDHQSFSCRARNNYTVTIANHKSYRQTYWFDGAEYSLSPGGQHTFTKLIGRTHRCQRGRIALPLVEFDRYDNDRRFTPKRVRLNGRSSYYYFDGDSAVRLRRG